MSGKKSSLFIGRWQPFHAGHKTLIESVLKQNKPVVIAIRDTEIDHKNPFSTFERWSMIQKELHEYGELVKIIVIPDIDEICYGRDVGYDIRKIDLDKDIENISGTKTREDQKPTKSIIWLTGQSGAGKTTLANALSEEINAVVLDGDEMRESISLGAGFSKEERENHNIRVARLAKVLSKRSRVIVSVIAPFQSTRKLIEEIANPHWVYVKRKLPISKDRPYEVPKDGYLIVDSDKQSTSEQVAKIVRHLSAKLV